MKITVICADNKILAQMEEYLISTLTEKHYRRKRLEGDCLEFLILFFDDEVEVLTDVMERFPEAEIHGSSTYSNDGSGYQSWTTVSYSTRTDKNGKRFLERSTSGGWA